MRSPPWRIPLSFTREGISERFASIVISICMDGKVPDPEVLAWQEFVRLPNHQNEPVIS